MRSAPLDDETIAIRALAFLAGDPERLSRFLAETGIGPETLRQAAGEPGFLAQVLEFVSTSDTLLLAFAANEGLRPDHVATARQRLAGSAAHEP